MTRRNWNAVAGLAAVFVLMIGCGGTESDLGKPCGAHAGRCTEDVTYCVSCEQARLGPPDTCQAYGDPGRYAGVDPEPGGQLCGEGSPCPAPYECTAAEPPGDYTLCLLPCRGRDCPEGYFCDDIDVGTTEDAIPCGFCHPEDI